MIVVIAMLLVSIFFWNEYSADSVIAEGILQSSSLTQPLPQPRFLLMPTSKECKCKGIILRPKRNHTLFRGILYGILEVSDIVAILGMCGASVGNY